MDSDSIRSSLISVDERNQDVSIILSPNNNYLNKRVSRVSKKSFQNYVFGILGAVAIACAAAVVIRSKFAVDNDDLKASLSECSEPYGLLPCSTSLTGNIFLMITYGYLLLKAAQLISEGSEMLLQVLDPGVIGGLVLPILGAFPDTLLVAVSGLGGTLEEAQEEVLVGMGVLAGSTIMILTLAWAGSLYAGRCDLDGPDGTSVDKSLTRQLDPYKTGITTDDQTRVGAWIMIISAIPFIIMQLPLIFQEEDEYGQLAAGIGLFLTLGGLIIYCYYQVSQPWLQRKKIENARITFIRTNALRNLHNLSLDKAWGGLLQLNGEPNPETLRKVFNHFDLNDDGNLSKNEIKALILGMNISQQGSVPPEEEVNAWMSDFDTNIDGTICDKEFFNGIVKWIQHVRPIIPPNVSIDWDTHAKNSHGELQRLMNTIEEEEEESEGGEEPKSSSQIIREAVILMASGAAIVAVFADPMVDTITNFSSVSGIPSFFVAFVVTPLASNASELVSSILFAMKKRKRTISLTYSQVYGAITMNNTMVLGVFLCLVYFRGITWEFSSEVTVILITTMLVGIVGGTRSTIPLWLGGFVLLLYPLSIALVAFLDYYVGWN